MSNAIAYTETTHYRHSPAVALCGSSAPNLTGNRAEVTCKRCLASLAKRDREFQQKARGWFRRAPRRELAQAIREDRVILPSRHPHSVAERCDAARAIAREEGRAL